MSYSFSNDLCIFRVVATFAWILQRFRIDPELVGEISHWSIRTVFSWNFEKNKWLVEPVPALRVIRLYGKSCLNLGCKNLLFLVGKNGNISKSVCSIQSGPFYLWSLGHDLSRNAFVVSILFPGAELHRRKGFSMTPEIRDFHDLSTFLGSCQATSRKPLGCILSVLGILRVILDDFWGSDRVIAPHELFEVFHHFRLDFEVS